MSQIGIIKFGAYLPKFYLDRKLIAEAWDFPEMPGGIAVKNYDEDTLTMAVEACFDCLKEMDPKIVDAIYFATTTSPYTEKQIAPIIADVLDLRKDITTMDITTSTRASTTALIRAYETIKSGAAHHILVIGADAILPEPETFDEFLYGDGAAALLIGDSDVVVSIESYLSSSDNPSGPWRRPEDRFTRQFNAKHESNVSYSTQMREGITKLLKKQNILPEQINKLVLYSPNPRGAMKLTEKMGFKDNAYVMPPFLEVGNCGNAFVLMNLILALKTGKNDNMVLLGGYGDGADILLMKIINREKLRERNKGCRGVSGYISTMVPLKTYAAYIQKKKKLETDVRYSHDSTPVGLYRDRETLLALYGVKCPHCGMVNYPIQPTCYGCKKMFEEEKNKYKLQKKGKIFTFTLDHLDGGMYYNTPIPRCVIDTDGGGRIMLNMTDVSDPNIVQLDMNVEYTFRWMHDGENFQNYYWKCRPIRDLKIQEEN